MPVVIIDNKKKVVAELKRRKRYDLMLRQHSLARQMDGQGHTYAMSDFSNRYNGDVFVWFVGYPQAEDNGWTWFHLIGGDDRERKILYDSVLKVLGPDSELLYSLSLD